MLPFFSLTNTDTDPLPEKNKKEDVSCTYGGVSAKFGYDKCRSRHPDIAETFMRIIFGCFVVMTLLSVGSLAYVLVHQYSEIYMPFTPEKGTSSQNGVSEKNTVVQNVSVKTLYAAAPASGGRTDTGKTEMFRGNLSDSGSPIQGGKRIVADKSDNYRYREDLADPCAAMSRPFGNSCEPQLVAVYQPPRNVTVTENGTAKQTVGNVSSDFVSVTDEYAERYHIPKGVMIQTNRYSSLGILQGDIVVEVGASEITDMNDMNSHMEIFDGSQYTVIRVFRRNRYIDVNTETLLSQMEMTENPVAQLVAAEAVVME